jgi:signal transduction histidine kinase
MLYKNNHQVQEVESLLKEAELVFQSNPDKAILLADKALGLSLELSLENRVASAKLLLLKANMFKGNIGAALDLSEECLTCFDGGIHNPFEYGELLRYLGMLHYKLNNYDLSLDFVKQSLVCYKKINDKSSMSKSMDLLGNIHTKKQQYPDAFLYFNECFKIKKELGMTAESISVSLNNIGLLFMDMEDYPKAKRYMREARRLLKNSHHYYFVCVNLQNLGVAKGKLGEYDCAIQLLKESLAISREHSFRSTEASILSNLSEFCYFEGIVGDSLQYAYEGIDICNALKLTNNIYATCMVTMFRCHHMSGNLEKAAAVGKDCMPFCRDIGYDTLAMDLIKELMEVLEKLGRIDEALKASKELLNLQTERYHKKKDFSIFRIQSKLEVQMKEQELKMQREMIQQQKKYNKELREANEELDRFVGMASHDLKEPIRTINTFGKFLSRYIKEEQKEYEFLHFIQDASERMGNLVDDLLSFARAGKIDSPTKSLKLMNVIFLVEQNMKSSLVESNATVCYDDLPIIQAHTTPMIQLFQNIVSNAIKYSRDSVPPVIHIKAEVTDEETIIKISDNGLGIDASQIDTIFNPFTRVHGQLKKEGSCIGLATCKKIIEKYNGKIWATSEVGVGTCISFSIPFSSHATDS